MANNNNVYQISGVIFDKPSRKVTSKKDGKEYEFKSIILEVRREYKDKTYTELPEFHLGWGVDDNGFDIGDKVQISFSVGGKKINSDFHKTELKALYIKHPDLQFNDTKEVGFDPIKKEQKDLAKTFVAPDPAEEIDDSGLPF